MFFKSFWSQFLVWKNACCKVQKKKLILLLIWWIFWSLDVLKTDVRWISFPKAHPEREAMILRASKVRSLTGLLWGGKSSSASFAQHKDRLQLQSQTNGCFVMSCWPWLVKFWVRNSPHHKVIHSVIVTNRTKFKLRNSKIIVSGDQWPLFLYT